MNNLKRLVLLAAGVVVGSPGPSVTRIDAATFVVNAIQNPPVTKPSAGASSTGPVRTIVRALDSTDQLVPRNVSVEVATHAGQRGVRLLNKALIVGSTLAVVQGSEFQDGTIDIDVSGEPASGASAGARGFIGVAFRIGSTPDEYECFYLRPTNGRADDQLRRNHSTEYMSEPEFPWQRLRQETPGVYESYVDLVAGAWTHLRIEVQGQSAKLFVNRPAEPSLIVNDLKHPAHAGRVALWIGDETDGYFRNLRIEVRAPAVLDQLTPTAGLPASAVGSGVIETSPRTARPQPGAGAGSAGPAPNVPPRADAFFRALASGDPERYETMARENFTPELLGSRTVSDRRKAFEQIRVDFGQMTLASAQTPTADTIVLVIHGATGVIGRVELKLESVPPNRITRIAITVEPGHHN
jgi:hypothetical protein